MWVKNRLTIPSTGLVPGLWLSASTAPAVLLHQAANDQRRPSGVARERKGESMASRLSASDGPRAGRVAGLAGVLLVVGFGGAALAEPKPRK